MKVLETIIVIILGLAIGFGLSGLIFWGIGSFAIWAFGISFTWTYWHGLAVAFIVCILSKTFKVTVNRD